MNLFFPNLTKNIIMHLTSTIMSSHTVFNYIMEHKENEFILLKNELLISDVNNKLIIIISLIKNILDKNNITNIDELIKNYKKPLVELLDDFSVISYKEIPTDNSINLPEPIKISLNSTLDVIEQINQVLHSIHDKIVNHKKSYIKYVSRINVHSELQQIKTLDIIFDKRLKMLLDLLVVYKIC